MLVVVFLEHFFFVLIESDITPTYVRTYVV